MSNEKFKRNIAILLGYFYRGGDFVWQTVKRGDFAFKSYLYLDLFMICGWFYFGFQKLTSHLPTLCINKQLFDELRFLF